MLSVTGRQSRRAVAARARRLLPTPIRRAAARIVASRREAEAAAMLAQLAVDRQRPIVVGPWLGEVGFELLYWVPFVRWFAERYDVAPDRLIVVSRGGAGTWYEPLASRTHDAFDFMEPDLFRRKNEARIGRLGEQKQIAVAPLDDEILAFVRREEGESVAVLHPSTMYRLFAPYWWGHQPLEWVTRHARYARLTPPSVAIDLPEQFTAVKFYFNDCFESTPRNRAFVERTTRELSQEGPVISLSSGIAVDDHAPCEPDVAAMQGIRHLLVPQTNLLVQSAIVARAQRFVGTYGGFAYLAPFYGVPSVGYYGEPRGFAARHLDLARTLFTGDGMGKLEARDLGRLA
jgi:hypothetical protein